MGFIKKNGSAIVAGLVELWQLAAISLIVEAVLDIAVLFLNRSSISTDF